jgi:hypothetical protein
LRLKNVRGAGRDRSALLSRTSQPLPAAAIAISTGDQLERMPNTTTRQNMNAATQRTDKRCTVESVAHFHRLLLDRGKIAEQNLFEQRFAQERVSSRQDLTLDQCQAGISQVRHLGIADDDNHLIAKAVPVLFE